MAITPASLLPVSIDGLHLGLIALPGTGRPVYWTGRVAIGLRYEPPRNLEQPLSSTALWVQQLLLHRRPT